MKIYQKEINGRLEIKPRNRIIIVKDGMQTLNPSDEMVIADGWVEFVPPKPEEEPVEEVSASIETEESTEVTEAKAYLESTDYKVIKCMEAYLDGRPLPYDIHELHREREEKRQYINSIESELLNQ